MQIKQIPIGLIDVDPAGNRPMEGIEELAESIDNHTLLQPIGVAFTPAGDRYRLVFGHRRLAAAKHLGWERIDARVVDVDDEKATLEAAAVVENADRMQLTLRQEVDAVGRVKAKLGEDATLADVAAELGKTTLWVAQRLALVRVIDAWWKQMEVDPRINRTVLYALARLSPKQQEEELPPADWPEDFDPKGFLEDVQALDAKGRLALSEVSWDLSDKLLVESAGACDGCEYRGDQALPLFPDAHVDEEPTCTNHACYETKSAAMLRRKAAEVEKEIGVKPKILVDSHTDVPFERDEFIRGYNAKKAAKGEKGAIPVIDAKKPDAVRWVKPVIGTGSDEHNGNRRSSNGDAAPRTPKPDSAKLKTLKRRRIALGVRKYCEVLPTLPCKLDTAIVFVLAFGTEHRRDFRGYAGVKDGDKEDALTEATELPERDFAKRLYAAVAPVLVKRLRIDRVEDEAEKVWEHAKEIAAVAGHLNDLTACLTEATTEIKTPKSLEKAAAKLEAKQPPAAKSKPKKAAKKKPAGVDRRKAASGERE